MGGGPPALRCRLGGAGQTDGWVGFRHFGMARFDVSLILRQSWEDDMSKHLADKRSPSTGARLKQFLRLARTPRETWHRPRGGAGPSRLVQFLRIDRGRSA